MLCILLQGIAGAGKSTLARQMEAEDLLGTKTVCADFYFESHDGYRFNPAELGKAHTACFRGYLDALRNEYYLKRLIVANTNLNPVDVSPYIAAARAYGHDWQILQVGCDPNVAADRNVHGVPRSKVLKMYERLQNFYAPREWWDHVFGTGDLAFCSALARRNTEQHKDKVA